MPNKIKNEDKWTRYLCLWSCLLDFILQEDKSPRNPLEKFFNYTKTVMAEMDLRKHPNCAGLNPVVYQSLLRFFFIPLKPGPHSITTQLNQNLRGGTLAWAFSKHSPDDLHEFAGLRTFDFTEELRDTHWHIICLGQIRTIMGAFTTSLVISLHHADSISMAHCLLSLLHPLYRNAWWCRETEEVWQRN